MGLRAIVEHYKKVHRPRAKVELAWFRGQPDLKTAVDTAARAINSQGKRYSHQCRISKKAMPAAIKALRGVAEELDKVGSFDELLQKIEMLVGHIDGIGDLYVYDTALRIGFFRKLAPRLVYLHAGTRVGARRLGLTTHRRLHLEVADVLAVAPEFQELTAGEIEDVLCIYKNTLKDQKAGTAAFEPPGESWCC